MHVTYVKYIDLISLNILHKSFNIFILPPSSIDIIVLFLYTVFIELHLSLRASVCVWECVEAVWVPWPRRLTLTRRLGADAADAGDD